MSKDRKVSGKPLPDAALDKVLTIPQVMELTTLSKDSLQRHHRTKFVELSPRRRGMTLRDALAIARGE
jgi:hypothetical protein